MPSLPTLAQEGFATAEEAEAYDRWYRAKVQKSLDNVRPGIPHEEMMAEVTAIIEVKLESRRKAAHASGDLESGS